MAGEKAVDAMTVSSRLQTVALVALASIVGHAHYEDSLQ